MKKIILISLIMLMSMFALTTGSVSASSHTICENDDGAALEDVSNLNSHKEEYCEAIEDVDDSKSNVESQLEEFDSEEDNIDELNQSLQQLQRDRERMKQSEEELIQVIVEATAQGSTMGGFSEIDTVRQSTDQKSEEIGTLINDAGQVVNSEYNSIRTTIRVSLFGSLAGGLLLGSIIGAAVPITAARRVGDKMRLSSDVTFDSKIAIIPAVVGIILIILGIVLLTTQIGWSNLIQVIL